MRGLPIDPGTAVAVSFSQITELHARIVEGILGRELTAEEARLFVSDDVKNALYGLMTIATQLANMVIREQFGARDDRDLILAVPATRPCGSDPRVAHIHVHPVQFTTGPQEHPGEFVDTRIVPIVRDDLN